MLVPLYGFVEGDTMGVLVLATSDMTLAQVRDTLRASASLRVDPDGDWDILSGGHRLAPELSVEEVGLSALCRVDLRRAAA